MRVVSIVSGKISPTERLRGLDFQKVGSLIFYA